MGGLHAVKDARKMQRILQTMVMEQSEHHIPAVFHLEGLSGAWVAGGMSFPSGIGRGASFDPELEEKVGAITARQELAVGITQILCPVLDIARDPRHGRHGEAYGEDPTLAAAMGSANVRGIQGQEVRSLCQTLYGLSYVRRRNQQRTYADRSESSAGDSWEAISGSDRKVRASRGNALL